MFCKKNRGEFLTNNDRTKGRNTMTWKEFKAKLESEGVRDEDEIRYIDTGNYPYDVTVEISPIADSEGRDFAVS